VGRGMTTAVLPSAAGALSAKSGASKGGVERRAFAVGWPAEGEGAGVGGDSCEVIQEA
jgi:hypothetical protein